MRSSAKKEPEDGETSSAPVRSIAATVQQYNTRRRRGSLRKVALLGRRAQSDTRRDGRPLTVDTGRVVEELVQKLAPKPEGSRPNSNPNSAAASTASTAASSTAGLDGLGVGVGVGVGAPDHPGSRRRHEGRPPGHSHISSSTTDDEDMVRIGSRSATPSLSPESLYAGFHGGDGRASGQRHSPFQQAKSPLSFSGSSIATSPLPPTHANWDYSETEWWGWVVLTATWLVFVIGMGSCLGVWSWAWDVGTTPYAPPELEDDPTLPIVGYYPALIILTGVMAWVWVVVAWVGMKYFRHAKISGD